MRTIGRNVLLFLTVICLTLVAVMPFGAGFSVPFRYEELVNEETVAAPLNEELFFSDAWEFDTEAQDLPVNTEINEEPSSSQLQLIEKEEFIENNTYVPELHNENVSQNQNEQTPENRNSYLSEGANENIYDLYFFSENKGSLDSAFTVNTYVFTLENRCMFRYFVTHDTLGALEGWKVSLYEEYYVNGDGGEKDYRLINTLLTDSGTEKDKSVELGLMPGAYRLVVTAGKSYTAESYILDVETKDGTGYEIECNDNIYRYTEIYSSVPLKGSASYFNDRQDEDWYLFRVFEDGFSEIRFAHPTIKDKVTVCWQVILYSESGNVLYSVNSLFTDESNKSGGLGLSAGNYYILVRNRVYTDITYTLSVTRTDDVGFENESNDTFSAANGLALNSTITGSVTEKNNVIDRDYFVFEVNTPGCAVIEFSHNPISDSKDKDGWNFILTDNSGRVLFKGISAWADDVKASPVIGLDKGIYYIRVDSENHYHSSEVYYLTVNFTESELWESEYNSTQDYADAMKPDIPINGVLAEMGTDFDYDWYSFELKEAADINILFSHEVLGYSKNIFVFTLYDYEGQEVATVDGKTLIECASDIETVTAEFNGLLAGKYYIKVTSGLFYDNISYSLKYTFSTEAEK